MQGKGHRDLMAPFNSTNAGIAFSLAGGAVVAGTVEQAMVLGVPEVQAEDGILQGCCCRA